MTFDPLKENFSLPASEEKILKFWETRSVFDELNRQVKDKEQFVFYEGPPTANGRPGIHHVIARTVKDLFCRYKTMQGFRVDRKAGWDTHGLPVEIEVEKALKLDSKAKILEYGVANFNKKCRASVFKYLEDWNKITRRIGYWLDLDDAYITLSNEYIESVWHILKQFFDRDLIYKGHKIIPFCPRCETGLSSHEVAQGYQMVRDPSVYVKVKSADGSFSYLVWTTTPWTLPSNAALCMKADADYVTVSHEDEKLVCAEALLDKLFETRPEILEKKTGAEFVGQRYEPLFDFYTGEFESAFCLITADFVTLDDGTGIVHIAPGFGADDYEAGKKHNLPILQAIHSNGVFKEEAGTYAGLNIKEANPQIVKDLKIAGKLFKKELYEHNYPFCWRCDSPLIYIARESWYIRTTQFKEQLLRNSNAINWVPDEIRAGRMQNWLENNVDWAISRERFWGTPLPIWVCDDECGKMVAVGSVEQLLEHATNGDDFETQRANGTLDLHKPFIDDVKLKCQCGSEMTRVPEVIDCWFDAGAMPYAQWHYPFENEEKFDQAFPAQFISEAVDQTRGWFYTLLAISTMLFDKAPFENVVVLEFILDKKGKKMSKHVGNVVDPFETIDKYGADPLRWYMVTTSNPWLPTKFDLNGLAEVIRKFFDTLRNTYSFFAIYANIDDVTGKAGEAGLSIEKYLESKAGEPEPLDQWIEIKYQKLTNDVTVGFDSYQITKPVRAVQSFVIEDLSNWYVRLNRRRFWAEGDDRSKMRAYLTLYRILESLCRLIAPVAPFMSELLWQELAAKNKESSLSVHLCNFPKSESFASDFQFEEAMDIVRDIVSLGRSIRTRKNLKVRQPLSKIMVALPSSAIHADFSHDGAQFINMIRDELNIKKVELVESLEELVTYSAKLNFKTAGPRLGKQVKQAAAIISKLSSDAVFEFTKSGSLSLEQLSDDLTLSPDEVEIIKTEKDGFGVDSSGSLTVALVTELSDDLIDEGFAREMINKIQNMRKTSGLKVTDQIRVTVGSSPRLNAAAARHEQFIRRETLAEKLEFRDVDSVKDGAQWDINGEKAAIAVVKV